MSTPAEYAAELRALADKWDPPAPPPPPPDARIVLDGDYQAKVSAAPEGATFRIPAGVHRFSVKPRRGQSFVGEPGAVLDGGGTLKHALVAHGGPGPDAPPDVTVQGLEIRGYVNDDQTAVIQTHLGRSSEKGRVSGWQLLDLDVHHNRGGGLKIGHRTVIRGCKVHHNGQLGVGGSGDDSLVEGCVIYENGIRPDVNWGHEGGGSKFVLSRRLILRGNHAHHNRGPGLWCDIDNHDILYENNVVEDNLAAGIFHEISGAAIVRGNTSRRNGRTFTSPYHGGAGIWVSASSDVTVEGNLVEDCPFGIFAVQQNRGGNTTGLDRLNVVGNLVVRASRGAAGVLQDIGDMRVFDRAIRFDGNRYEGCRDAFEWRNGFRRFAQWQDFGHDGAGAFTP